MALEAGGRADKLGNRHEGRWLVKQFLRLLREELESVTIESIGDDERGVDIWIHYKGGVRQAQQCKARNGSNEHWTIGDLKQKDILRNMKFQLNRDKSHEFMLVSGVGFTKLADVCESARMSDGNSESFYKYQIIEKGQSRIKIYREFCVAIDLDQEKEENRAEVFDYLRRMKITVYLGDYESKQDLLTEISILFAGDTEFIYNTLINYAEENDRLGNPIHCDDLYNFLMKNGAIPKYLTRDTRISPIIQKLRTEFKESIFQNLINKSIISRSETDECFNALQKSGLVILHGNAGMGKSGVLLELMERLEIEGISYLPLRVDRKIPKNSTLQYGKSMDLPDSPVQCINAISGTNPCILIIDQLDAVRWTSNHSLDAMDVCKALIREVLSLRRIDKDIKVLIACRTFDLNHDPEIKNWLTVQSKDNEQVWKRIEVNRLSAENVMSVIGDVFNNMAFEQKVLLSIPQNLAMWCELSKENMDATFTTSVDLLRQFWNKKIKDIENEAINFGDFKSTLDRFITYCEKNGTISIPSSYVRAFSDKVIAALESNGITQQQDNIISFCHQSYLDFLIAEKVVNEIAEGGDILTWIGNKEKQTLFRREQLRQALNLLFEESPNKFIKIVKDILFSEKVRFNFKHLALEVLGQSTKPNRGLENIIIILLGNLHWKQHVINTTIINNEFFVRLLVKNNIIDDWLNSKDKEAVNQGMNILKSVCIKMPDEVAELLKPHIDKSPEWNRAINGVIGMEIERDSESLFKMRIDLMEKGEYPYLINWKNVCSKTPIRALILLQSALKLLNDNEIDDINKENQRNRLYKWYDMDLEALLMVADNEPLSSWNMLIDEYVKLAVHELDESYWNYHLLYENYEHGQIQIEKGIMKLFIKAGMDLAQNSPKTLIDKINQIKSYNSSTLNAMIAKILSGISKEYADTAIGWLLEDITRLEVGNSIGGPHYLLASEIILKQSPYCSTDIFTMIEDKILRYHEINEIENAKYYLEIRKHGYYYHYWGRAQYLLLSCLDQERMSKKSLALLSVLKRRYVGYTREDIMGVRDFHTHWIGSTLDKNLLKISEKAWIDIIKNKNISFDHSGKTKRIDKEHNAESSVWQFSKSLCTVAKYYPERFAKLLLNFPQETHPSYISAIFDALRLVKVEDNFPEEIKRSWQPASIETIITVLNKFKCLNDRSIAISFCRLINDRSEETWPVEIIDRLLSLAMNFPDPQNGQLNVWDAKWDKNMDNATIHTLFDNTINCVKGIAAEAIGRLLWNNKNLIDKVTPAIETLIQDSHPVVRMASVFALMPIININIDKAVEWFNIATKDDLRIPGSYYSIRFINYTIKTHTEIISSIIGKMLLSSNEEILEKASEMISAYNIFYGIFDEDLEKCCNGTVSQKKAVILAASHLITKPDYAAKCREIIERFIDDDNEEVRKQTGFAFDRDIIEVKDNIQFVKKYISSKAFLDDTRLLYILQDYKDNLLDFSDIIFSICDAFSNMNNKELKVNTYRLNYRVEEVSELLLRLYDQSFDYDDRIFDKCLDAWDDMFESGILHIRNLTTGIDS
ncbi:hypothetical protein [Clostridium beijerinckii]|uniref:ATPase AAA-type core domain-containing protein n=1 Tax=Clostridium beijerinckii TaxID=1520 RepID=A0A1S9N467_CLOBE|nr:hypothetical protein [Clostridium beijerinckii]MZK51418.1 hypothetical protein [Clostridium beijerinckii]MZK59618.1 hypothetical protein [Clostridium beijerinckii]MZK69738.1 hypothetical protein [Clostridium beijerinckii]MZK75115.1 hypothetical protein [Clostridium beijerinckii]MZK84828.1 hypothetical protein [Clostridium beijerinckii]